MKKIHTTAGALGDADFGLVLPHEHIFTETGDAPAFAYQGADGEDALRVMSRHLNEAKEAGVTLMCEATPIGVGRRADIVTRIARACELPIAMATGFYREPWITQDVHDADVDALSAQMMNELMSGIESTGVRAGFIKLGTSDDGMTACEEKLLRAACRASRQTGAAICSHTTRAAVADRALDICAEEGVAPSRFVWFHASSEPDDLSRVRVARRGAFLGVDYDPRATCALILRLLDGGFQDQIILSMDSGWYNPRFAHGGDVRGYVRMMSELFPMMREAGIDDRTRVGITHDNVFRAYAR